MMDFNTDPGFEAGSAGPSTPEFLANCLRDQTRLNLRIHAEDEMFLRELAEAGGDQDLASWRYLQTGESIARAVGQFVDWRFGGFDNHADILGP